MSHLIVHLMIFAVVIAGVTFCLRHIDITMRKEAEEAKKNK